MPATAVAHRPSSCRRARRGCPRRPQVCSCRSWAVVGEALASPQVREGGLSATATCQLLLWPVDGVSPNWYELPCCVVGDLDPTGRRSRPVAASALDHGLGPRARSQDPHCYGDEFCMRPSFPAPWLPLLLSSGKSKVAQLHQRDPAPARGYGDWGMDLPRRQGR
jgi:hypothetical protein